MAAVFENRCDANRHVSIKVETGQSGGVVCQAGINGRLVQTVVRESSLRPPRPSAWPVIEQKLLDAEGRILPAFEPRRSDFKVSLPGDYAELAPAVIDLLAGYQMERHIRKEKDEGTNRLRKEIQLTPEFQPTFRRSAEAFSVNFKCCRPTAVGRK